MPDPVIIAARLLEIRASMRRLFAERWPAKSAEWQEVIRAVMGARGLGSIEATMLLIKEGGPDAEGPVALMILAACCDLIGAEKTPEVR